MRDKNYKTGKGRSCKTYLVRVYVSNAKVKMCGSIDGYWKMGFGGFLSSDFTVAILLFPFIVLFCFASSLCVFFIL
jgi:hypothetical protein